MTTSCSLRVSALRIPARASARRFRRWPVLALRRPTRNERPGTASRLLPVRSGATGATLEEVNRLRDELAVSGHLLDVNVRHCVVGPQPPAPRPGPSLVFRVGQGDWLSCPIVENAVVRIVCNPKYSNAQASPAVVIDSLASLTCRWSASFRAGSGEPAGRPGR